MEKDSLSSIAPAIPPCIPNPPPCAPCSPWYQQPAADSEPEKSRFEEIFEGEEEEKMLVENLIVNVIQAKKESTKHKAEQKLKNILEVIDDRNKNIQIQEDEEMSLKILQEDRKQEKKKEENNSINLSDYIMVKQKERRAGQLNEPSYSPALGEMKGSKQDSSLSGSQLPNTTSNIHSSRKMTHAKQKEVKKPDGNNKKIQDLKNETDLPNYNHIEIITIED